HTHPLSEVFVFARGERERQFAIDLGASWSGKIEEHSPEQLSAIIDTTPVWKPVLHSLENLVAGGKLVANAISKENSDIDSLLSLDYQSHLWLEKEIKSVANVTREDVAGFLSVASSLGIEAEVTEYGLEEANAALSEIRRGGGKGAKVLKIADR
ncbi:alcohol dehydrogenase, partial [Candidatus Poribacteria bacterium]|nr:alcohol dehydrogenase [Candidatus Poribacteria bacterium]